MKEKKRVFCSRGKAKPKEVGNLLSFSHLCPNSVRFFTMPNTTITTVATPMTPSLLPLPTTQPPPLSPYYFRRRNGSRPRPKWWGQGIHLSLLNPPNPLTLPLGHHVHHIIFFNTVITTPASKIYFFLKKSIRLDQVDKGNGIHIFFFMKKLNIILLSYKSLKS